MEEDFKNRTKMKNNSLLRIVFGVSIGVFIANIITFFAIYAFANLYFPSIITIFTQAKDMANEIKIKLSKQDDELLEEYKKIEKEINDEKSDKNDLVWKLIGNDIVPGLVVVKAIGDAAELAFLPKSSYYKKKIKEILEAKQKEKELCKKACFDYQNALTEAIKKYEATGVSFPKENDSITNSELDLLVKKGYLKTSINKPKSNCSYTLYRNWNKSFYITCKEHGRK